MCGGVHMSMHGEVEGLVSVERWSYSRGASCLHGGVLLGEVDGLVSVERWSVFSEVDYLSQQCVYAQLTAFQSWLIGSTRWLHPQAI